MRSVKRFFYAAGFLLLSNTAFSQSGYMDNALNYSRLIIAKTPEGVYKLVGPFKVIGTSYLFGEKMGGDLFSSEAKAWNISLSYNTYNQEVEFYSSSNPDKPLVKEVGTVDSFILHQNIESGIISPLKFVYGELIGSKEKAYFQEVCTGTRFNLYKRYKSELGYVSSNYIQSELRQFDLLYEYFYTDSESKSIKKIKANGPSVIKEFKSIKDISAVVNNDDYSVNPEEALKKAFDYLNN
ncbi:MAG: hypothetical protein HZB42_02730 [Sphingobacteriales bacterium]|nr:hypothetical protein [Sphingobacteriales bacterium]